MPHHPIALKRAYEPADPSDGARVLVERLWPRGVSKEDAALDLWLKEVAPSAELRTWYDHDPERWDGFRRRYRDELEERNEEVERLAAMAREGPLTLVLASRDVERSSAALLKRYLEERLDGAADGDAGVSVVETDGPGDVAGGLRNDGSGSRA